MADTKEYISNITLPNGETKYVKDSDLTLSVETNTNNINTNTNDISALKPIVQTNTEDISALKPIVQTNTTNINLNKNNINANSLKIDTNKNDIANNKANIKTNTDDISTMKTELSEMIDKIYPVGSIYITASTTNPNVLFGVGEWEKIEDRFLLASGETYGVGATGGEAEHTLTVDEMPSHNHTANQYNVYCNNSGDTHNTASGSGWYFNQNHIVTDNTGGGKAHNNMPPYLTVNMWKRIS